MRNISHKFILLFLAFLLLAAFAQAKAEFTPPEGFLDELDSAIVSGYNLAVSEPGWSSTLDAPNYQFTASDQVRLEELGQTLRGLAKVNETGLVSESALKTKLSTAAHKALAYQWVPDGTGWGVENGEKLPEGPASYVLPSVTGVLGANAECKEETVSFNQWIFSFGSQNTELKTTGGAAASGIAGVLSAADLADGSLKSNLLSAGKNSASSLLSLLVMPDGSDFGIEQSKLAEKSGGMVPVGVLPSEARVYNNGDTKSCSDGAFIKYNTLYLHEAAEGAVAFKKMFDVSGEEKYEEAVSHIIDGVLDLRDCDGMIDSFIRIFTPYAANNTCQASGEDSFEKYPTELLIDNYMETTYDTVFIMYLLQEANQKIYVEEEKFKDTLLWLLKLEESDSVSVQARKTGFMVRRGTDYLAPERRPAAQAMAASLFLRAACLEKGDTALRNRFKETGIEVAQKAFASSEIDLYKKPGGALAGLTGKHALGLKALSEVREIFVVGCSTAPDLDEDGYYDDPSEAEPDCNDNNASIHPGATEVCDLADNDCDGETDEGFDLDADGYATCQGDCDDANASINPAAAEKMNRKDDNCNGLVDEVSLVVDSTDEEGSPLANTEVMLFLYGNPLEGCADQTDDLIRVKNECEAAASCRTNQQGICFLTLSTASYLAVFEENGELTSKSFDLRKGQVERLFLRQEMEVEAEDMNASDANVAGGDANASAFALDFSGLFSGMTGLLVIVAIVLGIVLVAVLVVLVYVVRVKFKGEPPSLGKKKPSKTPEQELADFRGRWSFKK